MLYTSFDTQNKLSGYSTTEIGSSSALNYRFKCLLIAHSLFGIFKVRIISILLRMVEQYSLTGLQGWRSSARYYY
jgi:hypothetical protein